MKVKEETCFPFLALDHELLQTESWLSIIDQKYWRSRVHILSSYLDVMNIFTMKRLLMLFMWT